MVKLSKGDVNNAFPSARIAQFLLGDKKQLMKYCQKNWASYAAMTMLFSQDLAQIRPQDGLSPHAQMIRNAVHETGPYKSVLGQVYTESPLTLLAKLEDASKNLPLVFHLSHLFLRILLFPDSTDTFIIFKKLHTH